MKTGIRHVALALAVAGACVSVRASAQDFQWKLYTALGTSDVGTGLHKAFAEDIGKASNGRLKITVFTAGEMPYKATDVLRAVSTRQVDMAHIAVGFMAGDLPELNAYSVPFSCTSMDEFYEKAMPAVAPTFDSVISQKFSVRPLVHWTMPAQQLWLSKPVNGIGDLQRLKIRAWNREQVETMKLLGGAGLSITPAEVIPALQRGVVDGAFTAGISAVAWKIHDVIKHGYLINFTLSHEVVAVNEAALKELPDDLRDLLLARSKEWVKKYREGVNAADREAQSTLVSKGMTLKEAGTEEIKKLRDLTAPIADTWVEKNGENARKMLSGIRTNCS